MMSFNTVCVVGLGYIGLPTAAMLASRGLTVIGVDVNRLVVDTVNNARVHIVEPDLDFLVQGVVRQGLLRASVVPETADAFLIAVPTPFKGEHEPDLKFVREATYSIAPVLKKGDLLVLESTSPVGTTEQIARWLSEARPDLRFPLSRNSSHDVSIAYCPERVLPGNVIRELVANDRVVGGLTENCAERACALYKRFVEGNCLVTSARTAEMCKLTENSFRDVNIAFANELSLICDQLGIDVWQLIKLANHHPRVKILQPGPGVGGHCIAVDPWFIVHSSPEKAQLIRTARHVNDGKPEFVIAKVRAAAKQWRKPRILCMGLSFKANIDDLRESPAVHIVEQLAREHEGCVTAVEPFIAKLPRELEAVGVVLAALEGAIDEADIVVLLVDHDQFRSVNPTNLQDKIVVDTRGIWSDQTISEPGGSTLKIAVTGISPNDARVVEGRVRAQE